MNGLLTCSMVVLIKGPYSNRELVIQKVLYTYSEMIGIDQQRETSAAFLYFLFEEQSVRGEQST